MKELIYDRNKVIEYAKKWALSRNPKYYNFDNVGGDCTSFVSQCIFAGANVMNYTKDVGWYYIDGNNKSPSWSGVDFLYKFLINNKSVGPYGKEVKINDTVTKPEDPTYEGFEFVGWYVDDTLYNFDEPVKEDLTITAKWEEINDVN